MAMNGKLERMYTSILGNKKNIKMKNRQLIYLKFTLLLEVIFTLTVRCDRDLSDDVEFASYSNTGEIFIDGFMGGLDYFPFGDSFAEAFSVDKDEKYAGTASMRFDIPVYGVGYGGATFPSIAPRDLSGYDALTFWAKASQGADINEIGFGINGDTNNKYQVTMQNLPLTTKWQKYIIAIPDASKLFEEKGMFWYAEGAGTACEEGGYTFWIDELKFEKLGTIAQAQPAIFNDDVVDDKVKQRYICTNVTIDGLTQTFNLASGTNQTLAVAPSYFTFTSSDVDVARVSELGVVSVVDTGTATITASLGGVKASGSLIIESLGVFPHAPTPIHNASNVISVFSDADDYNNVPVDFYNGFWEPYQTTKSDDFEIDDDKVLNYTDFNFVGTSFSNPTVNASEMTHAHFDIFIPAPLNSGAKLIIKIKDFGNDNVESDGDDSTLVTILQGSDLKEAAWSSIDIPLALANKSNLGLIVYENDGTNLTNFYVDNIYFFK